MLKKESEKYVLIKVAEMDMESKIKNNQRTQKLLGMVEVIEINGIQLSFGKSETVRRALMEQLQEVGKKAI